jgi:hypothetical protein
LFVGGGGEGGRREVGGERAIRTWTSWGRKGWKVDGRKGKILGGEADSLDKISRFVDFVYLLRKKIERN